MVIDTTDATFEQDVLIASDTTPIVVDLWAPWCGPCKTLGPIMEKVVDETEGAVILVKANIDENPNIARSFNVQSIPAVFALKDRKVINSFIGAVPENTVREFIASLAPKPSEVDLLVAQGDEKSLRTAIELEPGHAGAIEALAQILIERHDAEEALELLARVPETTEARHLGALARIDLRSAQSDDVAGGSIDERLDTLLELVKNDDGARQEYLDLLESLELDDPRRSQYRRALSSKLF